MAAPRKLPPPAELKRLQEDGKTASEVASMYGVSMQSVYNRQSTNRVKKDYKVRAQNQFMPWDLMKPSHQRSSIARRLRHAHALAAGDGVMNKTVRAVIESWLNNLEYNNFVISYHPESPASHLAEEGGFFLRPRRSGDLPGLMQLPASNEQPPTRQMVEDWASEWTDAP